MGKPLQTALALCLVLLLFHHTTPWYSIPPRRRRGSLRTSLVAVAANVAVEPSVAALHWNINTAAQPAQLDAVGAVIKAHAPVVVGLNEVSLSNERFRHVARSWGFQHSLLLRTDRAHRFNVGLIATTPLEQVVHVDAPTFFHGLLCARLPALGIHVCACHLTPHSPAKRLKEAEALLRLLPAGPTLLLGDLNALSPRDQAAHGASGLKAVLEESKSWAKFSVGGALDYSVIDMLTAAGSAGALVDLHAGSTPTVPTTRGGDPRHVAPMRLDYALGSRALVAHCAAAEARAITDERAGGASDHYPLLVTLKGWHDAVTTGASATSPPAAVSTSRPASPAASARASTGPSVDGGDVGGDAPRRCAARADYYRRHLSEETMARCAAMSGLRAVVLQARGDESGGGATGGRLGRCAVVGSSGLLQLEPRGAQIDGFDAVVRLNAAPTAGFEAMAGSRTDARLVNIPQSEAWARKLRDSGSVPAEVSSREALLLMGSTEPWRRLPRTRFAAAAKLNKTFRTECVTPFFSEAERAAHRAAHRNKLTPTFGFEAVVHALYSCDSVDAFGFFLDPQLDEGAAPAARAVPYHYWEQKTVDRNAPDPAKPWTFASHNFATEATRLRHMATEGCLLTLHLPTGSGVTSAVD